MTAVKQIKAYIKGIPVGEPFPSTVLRPFAATDNIRQILNRLVKAGGLKRVARGVFVKTHNNSRIGEILPSAVEVAKKLSESTGETIIVHGAEAARQLQLTTQVPLKLIFYTSGNTRSLKIANQTIKLKHVNPSRLIAVHTVPGLVISALTYLGQENVTLKTLEHIRHQISLKKFKATVALMSKMPAWLSDIFYRYEKEKINE